MEEAGRGRGWGEEVRGPRREAGGGRMRGGAGGGAGDRTEGKGERGVGSHYVEGGDVTDGDGWLHVRQV